MNQLNTAPEFFQNEQNNIFGGTAYNFNFNSLISSQINKGLAENRKHNKSEREEEKDDSQLRLPKDTCKRQYIKKNPEKVKRWTREESLLYEQFVELNYDTMKNSALKRNTKIFMMMSKYIKTKTQLKNTQTGEVGVPVTIKWIYSFYLKLFNGK